MTRHRNFLPDGAHASTTALDANDGRSLGTTARWVVRLLGLGVIAVLTGTPLLLHQWEAASDLEAARVDSTRLAQALETQ
ncbi:MAG TPA: hypothetical protein VJ890_27330, partial [Vineibacter sp.]|nr:hypothetical protein [Vineibacter sp.]